MQRFTRIDHAPSGEEAVLTVTLDHVERRRARFRAKLSDGTTAGFLLPRGTALRAGYRVRSDDGRTVVTIRAREELVSAAHTPDTHLLTRAAYHLGNRHVPLSIERARLLYPHDHVLDAMCRELGLTVTSERIPFEPEQGGYAGDPEGHSHAEHSHG